MHYSIIKQLNRSWRMRNNPEAAALITKLFWYVTLVLVGVCICFYVAYGSWMLVRVFALSGAVPQGSDSIETLSRDSLERVLGEAQLRQVTYENLINTPRAVIDPGR